MIVLRRSQNTRRLSHIRGSTPDRLESSYTPPVCFIAEAKKFNESMLQSLTISGGMMYSQTDIETGKSTRQLLYQSKWYQTPVKFTHKISSFIEVPFILIYLSSIAKQESFAYVNHARIHSWNLPVLSNGDKVSCSRKQREPLRFKL